jgi:hypothetical protein
MNMQMQAPPNDVLGWTVIVVGAIATLAVIVGAVYWTIYPGETDPRHPKHMILRNDR